jgi:hypothetical protein
MNQTEYWIVSICLSGSAFIVSLISLGFNWKNRVDQKAATRLSKKTELLTKLVEVKSTFGHLAMIYAQQLLLIKDREEIGDGARFLGNKSMGKKSKSGSVPSYTTKRS